MVLRFRFIVACTVVLAVSFAPCVRADEAKVEDSPLVIPVFRLRGPLIEAPVEEGFPFSLERRVTLHSLVTRLNKARDDARIKAVAITVENVNLGPAQLEELRQAIAGLRAAGKDVFAHADGLTMSQYILLAGASHLGIVPTGDVWLDGLYGEQPYLRGLLEKVGVVPDFLTCGEYKSAAEMFMRDAPSEQAEGMTNRLFDSLFATQIDLIVKGRGVDAEKARAWIDGGPYQAQKAKELGIVDAVEQRQEFEARIKDKVGPKIRFDRRYGRTARPTIDFSTPLGVLNFYAELLGGRKKTSSKDSIAIVHVDGPIVLGDVEADPFGASAGIAASTPLRRALDKAASDDSIKAVVLRINSPGGSATASEIILGATKRVRAKKPFVVSMGDVAGSGGYYVACGAETVFADRSTITGSIGVVAGKFATTGMWNHVGVSWKSYARGHSAGLLSTAAPFSQAERERLQSWMDEIYDVFKSHVQSARGDRLKKPLDELAGGRVYTGQEAIELGLIDRIGTLQDAIQLAAQQAKLEKFETRQLPEPRNFFELLMDEAGDGGSDDPGTIRLASTAGGLGSALRGTVLPLLGDLDPRRFKAIVTALRQLETLQAEGASLVMPELVFGR